MEAQRWCRLTAALVAIGTLSACQRKAPDLTPEGAVRELLDRIDRIETDPTEARAVYDLLALPTRQNLIERARRASTTSGREIPPQDMLAPGRFSLRFEPRKMHTRVADDRAVVDVTGIDPETDRAEVPCVLEDGRWRIEIPLPPLAPAERRPEPG
ncbi:MAG TPA: hypothetical protein VK550_06175 [Polyangiaceae bacterium]|jgi:hypothetical protein|nr:hypothetical protein [Polyangiaceae bacterium]